MEVKSLETKLRPEDYAAIYARKSIKSENNSILSQLSLARDVLYKNNLILYKEYWDEESATKLPPSKRQGFSRLLKDAKAGKFKTVIVYRRDRLARRVHDLIEIKNTFKKYRIKIIYSNDGEYQPSESYLSDFIENIIMAVDELEPQIVAERTNTGRVKKRERKEYSGAGKLPFGFERISQNEKTFYRCNYQTVPLIRELFKMYSKNNDSKSMMDIVKELNNFYENKLPTTSNQVGKIIRNPIYAGYQFINSKYTVFDLFQSDDGLNNFNPGLLQKCVNVQPVVDFDLWVKCITVWRVNYKAFKRKKNQEYLFKGLLLCGKCKKPIKLINNKYRCISKDCSSFNADYFKKELIKYLLDNIIQTMGLESVISHKITQLKRGIQTYNRQLKTVGNDLEKYTLDYVNNFKDKYIANGCKELISDAMTRREDVKARIYELEARIYRLQEEKEKLNGSINRKGLTRYFLSNQERAHHLISTLVDQVIVNGKENELNIEIR